MMKQITQQRYNLLYAAISLILFSITISFQVNGQAIARQSIGTLGGSYSANQVLIHQCIGQVHGVANYYEDNMESRHGFIQPNNLQIVHVRSSFESNLAAYPNPTTESVRFNFTDDIGAVTIKVFAMDGKCVFQSDIYLTPEYQLNCGDWMNGIYLITVTDQLNHTYHTKLIKQ